MKILLWVVSNDSRFFNPAMKILERQHNDVEVIGVTANVQVQLTKNGRKVNFIPLNEVKGEDYDTLLVVGAKQIGMSKIVQAARQLNFPEKKLLADWIVCIPGFALEKYRRLQRSRLSILPMNCFGGHIYHELGLERLSPIINMYLKADDFIRFLRAPRVYMEENMTLKEMVWNEAFGYHHPIATLGNIDFILNHYRNFEQARDKWNERKARINWYNLFVTTYTEREEILEQFDELPYGKKVCFVPFKSDLDSAWYINPKLDYYGNRSGFYQVVNNFAKGDIFYYDPFDMLLYGKKTQLIDM